MKTALIRRIVSVLVAAMLLAGSASAEALLRAGGSFGFAVDELGGIWGWGDNTKGQLGNGGNKRQFHPVPAAVGLQGQDIADIQCGNENALFLMKDGSVYACGVNCYGQLGVGSHLTSSLAPIRVEGLESIVKIASGYGHCLALTEDGRVYAWGRNNLGQLGNGERKNAPTPVLLPLQGIADIQCGGKFSLALDRAGDIWGWGDNEYGQLMDQGRRVTCLTAPVRLTSSGGYTAIACSGSTAFALDRDGVLCAWGRNDYWQMGTLTDRPAWPVSKPVELPEGLTVSGMAAYNTHIVVWGTDGSAWMWGKMDMGQNGTDHRLNKTLPQCSYPSGVTAMAVGSLQSYVLLESGDVLSCGYNKYGQSGTSGKAMFYQTWQDTGLNLRTGVWQGDE